MAGNRSRVVFAGLLGAAVAGLTVQGERFVAAQPVPATAPGKEKDKAKEKDKDVWGDDLSSPFGFPYERDSKKQLEAAREYLTFKEVPWNIVSPLLQGILDSKSDSFFNVKYQVGGRTETNRISVKTEANRIIAAFRKEGLEFYQQSYGQAAAALLDEAVKANYDPAMLADLSQRYFHTKAGAEGTVLLGSLYLERGNYLEAAYAFERLLGRPNTDAYLTPHTLFKAALALKRSGDPRHVAPAKAATERLVAAVARDGLRVGRRAYSADQLRAELDRPVGALRLAAVGEWSGRYGNAARSGTVDGGPPFLVPVFEPKPLLFAHDDVDRRATTWIGDELDKLFDPKVVANKGVPLPGFFPVTTADLVIYRGYGGVYAVAARDHVHRGRPVQAGEVRWAARTTFGLQQLQTPGTYYYDDAKVDEQVAAWWLTYKSTGAASLLYENPQLGALAHDGQNVYYLDDLAVPPPPTLQNPNFGGMPDGGRQSGQLGEAVRAGELNAVDLGTGTLVWTLGRYATSSKSVRLANPAQATPPATEEDADKITSAFHLCLNAVFLGPPLPLNGRLYVLVEQAGAVRLLCLDPKALAEVRLNVEVRKPVNRADGVEEVQWEAGEQNLRVPALVWQQKLGRPMNPLPGDSVRRVQGAFLAAGEGILVCPTNSGAVVGVDVMSRSLLWAHAYRTVDAGPSSPGNMGMRGGRPPRFNPDGTPMMGAQLSTERWRAAAPIVAGGRVLVAAYDSDRLDCLDVRTGKVLWSTPRQTGDLYVGGVVNDKVLVVGKGGVRAYPLAAEAAPEVKPVWTITLAATPTGHGVAGKGVFYLPVRPENAGKDGVPAAEIWALNADTGAVASRTAARKRADGAGTDLVKYGLGNLVFQNGQVVAQSATEVAVYPQLEVKKAEMDRRLAANPKDPEGLTDRGELLLDDGKVREAVTDFREAFRNGPPETVRRRLREKLYVAYTELLKEDFAAAEGFLTEYEGLLDVPADADDPFENKRREDEGKRRKRLYLYLLAKGREAQGRTAEAFDRYLALAALGEGRELFDLPDEAGVKMRPDVWARGRIEGLIRKAADPSARAALEARVNTEWAGVGNDPRKLRDFVAVFGLYFPAGAEAELRLAEALLAAGGEDDAREAQVRLSQVRATAADPGVRARATAALAAQLTKAGLPEDAVALYAQLGSEFADTPVAGGKTGADLLTDVLTDRRLLPYLEPARFPLPARVRVEDRGGQNQQAHLAAFDVEPEGELFPAYRRLRFTVDTASSGNGTWTLRAVDRATGTKRAEFPDLHQPQVYNGSFSNTRFVQAGGHLLLVHLGPWVYCLDLAEKKERWRKNLLGDGPVAPGQPQPADIRGDGDEAVVRYTDGAGQTVPIAIGRSAVIQPGYVALLTRDGLEVYEPGSKERKLWTRRNLPDRCRLYGDARTLVLVEMAMDAKPASAKLLRAVDGMPVDGAPDAGDLLRAAKAYRLYGAQALLSEAGKDGERVLRLVDLATGKDVWRREFAAGAVPVRSADPAWAGFLSPAGELEVVDVKTGKPAAKLAVDPAKLDTHLKDVAEVKLFADPDRFFAVLDKSAGAGGAGLNRTNQPFALRTQAVNGPLYCFDRATGRRLWFVDDLFDGQRLVLERFADLPVVMAFSAGLNRAGGQTVYKVVVVEKERGLVRFYKEFQFDNNPFQTLTVDARAGTVDLNKHDRKIRVTADDAKPGQ